MIFSEVFHAGNQIVRQNDRLAHRQCQMIDAGRHLQYRADLECLFHIRTQTDGAVIGQQASRPMKEPGSESTYLALFSNFIAHPEELEKAYKDKYGKDLEYTYADDLGFGAKNAGYEYLYRLSQLKVTFISDGDEIVQAVANSTADHPVLGLASAGKITNRDDNKWPIAWVTDLAPYVSTLNTSYVYTVPKSNSPAGSRLFIRYMMGGDNGSGDGYTTIMTPAMLYLGQSPNL